MMNCNGWGEAVLEVLCLTGLTNCSIGFEELLGRVSATVGGAWRKGLV